MSTRISSTALVLALAACGGSQQEPPPGEKIACAPGGATAFSDTCTLERRGNRLIVRHPGGEFRQLEIVSDGGVAALDGAEGATESVLGDGTVEVQVAGDRYRFPLETPGSVRR